MKAAKKRSFSHSQKLQQLTTLIHDYQLVKQQFKGGHRKDVKNRALRPDSYLGYREIMANQVYCATAVLKRRNISQQCAEEANLLIKELAEQAQQLAIRSELHYMIYRSFAYRAMRNVPLTEALKSLFTELDDYGLTIAHYLLCYKDAPQALDFIKIAINTISDQDFLKILTTGVKSQPLAKTQDRFKILSDGIESQPGPKKAMDDSSLVAAPLELLTSTCFEFAGLLEIYTNLFMPPEQDLLHQNSQPLDLKSNSDHKQSSNAPPAEDDLSILIAQYPTLKFHAPIIKPESMSHRDLLVRQDMVSFVYCGTSILKRDDYNAVTAKANKKEGRTIVHQELYYMIYSSFLKKSIDNIPLAQALESVFTEYDKYGLTIAHYVFYFMDAPDAVHFIKRALRPIFMALIMTLELTDSPQLKQEMLKLLDFAKSKPLPGMIRTGEGEDAPIPMITTPLVIAKLRHVNIDDLLIPITEEPIPQSQLNGLLHNDIKLAVNELTPKKLLEQSDADLIKQKIDMFAAQQPSPAAQRSAPPVSKPEQKTRKFAKIKKSKSDQKATPVARVSLNQMIHPDRGQIINGLYQRVLGQKSQIQQQIEILSFVFSKEKTDFLSQCNHIVAQAESLVKQDSQQELDAIKPQLELHLKQMQELQNRVEHLQATASQVTRLRAELEHLHLTKITPEVQQLQLKAEELNVTLAELNNIQPLTGRAHHLHKKLQSVQEQFAVRRASLLAQQEQFLTDKSQARSLEELQTVIVSCKQFAAELTQLLDTHELKPALSQAKEIIEAQKIVVVQAPRLDQKREIKAKQKVGANGASTKHTQALASKSNFFAPQAARRPKRQAAPAQAPRTSVKNLLSILYEHLIALQVATVPDSQASPIEEQLKYFSQVYCLIQIIVTLNSYNSHRPTAERLGGVGAGIAPIPAARLAPDQENLLLRLIPVHTLDALVMAYFEEDKSLYQDTQQLIADILKKLPGDIMQKINSHRKLDEKTVTLLSQKWPLFNGGVDWRLNQAQTLVLTDSELFNKLSLYFVQKKSIADAAIPKFKTHENAYTSWEKHQHLLLVKNKVLPILVNVIDLIEPQLKLAHAKKKKSSFPAPAPKLLGSSPRPGMKDTDIPWHRLYEHYHGPLILLLSLCGAVPHPTREFASHPVSPLDSLEQLPPVNLTYTFEYFVTLSRSNIRNRLVHPSEQQPINKEDVIELCKCVRVLKKEFGESLGANKEDQKGLSLSGPQ